MFTTLLRLIKYGIQSFKRSALTSVATIIVMVIALVFFEGLIIFNVVTDTAIKSLQDKIDISVYIKTNVSEDKIFEFKQSLESLEEVRITEYISRDRALEIFEERYKDNPTISQALIELGSNPLFASLNVKAHNPEDYAFIASHLTKDAFKDIIEKITYTDSQTAIERLNSIASTAERAGFALTIFLAVTAALVIFNTIRLAIYANREEISIMRLVGASDIFINGPYIVQAIIFAILAAIASIVITAPFINLSSPYVTSFIAEMNLHDYFYSHIFILFMYQLLFGIVLGIVSGMIAVRRYLKI